MSSLFVQTLGLSRMAALARASTIMGGWIGAAPDLPLSSPDLDLPLPAIIRPPVGAFDDRHIRRHRGDVLWLRRCGRRHLAAGEWRFVGELARWRGPLTISEADRLAMLVDRVDWAKRELGSPA